jgi:hypothetical protein
MAANAFVKGPSGAAPFVALALLLPAPIADLNPWLKKKRRDDRSYQKSLCHPVSERSMESVGWEGRFGFQETANDHQEDGFKAGRDG